MLDILKRQKFEKAVLQTIEQRLLQIHGQEIGGECLGFFSTAILRAQEIGDIPDSLVDRFRKSGFTVDDAATAFYDASITAIKNLAKNLDQHPDVELVVKNMEVALDQMFLANPGMVVPKNGSAGPMMSDFTKDAELR